MGGRTGASGPAACRREVGGVAALERARDVEAQTRHGASKAAAVVAPGAGRRARRRGRSADAEVVDRDDAMKGVPDGPSTARFASAVCARSRRDRRRGGWRRGIRARGTGSPGGSSVGEVVARWRWSMEREAVGRFGDLTVARAKARARAAEYTIGASAASQAARPSDRAPPRGRGRGRRARVLRADDERPLDARAVEDTPSGRVRSCVRRPRRSPRRRRRRGGSHAGRGAPHAAARTTQPRASFAEQPATHARARRGRVGSRARGLQRARTSIARLDARRTPPRAASSSARMYGASGLCTRLADDTRPRGARVLVVVHGTQLGGAGLARMRALLHHEVPGPLAALVVEPATPPPGRRASSCLRRMSRGSAHASNADGAAPRRCARTRRAEPFRGPSASRSASPSREPVRRPHAATRAARPPAAERTRRRRGGAARRRGELHPAKRRSVGAFLDGAVVLGVRDGGHVRGHVVRLRVRAREVARSHQRRVPLAADHIVHLHARQLLGADALHHHLALPAGRRSPTRRRGRAGRGYRFASERLRHVLPVSRVPASQHDPTRGGRRSRRGVRRARVSARRRSSSPERSLSRSAPDPPPHGSSPDITSSSTPRATSRAASSSRAMASSASRSVATLASSFRPTRRPRPSRARRARARRARPTSAGARAFCAKASNASRRESSARASDSARAGRAQMRDLHPPRRWRRSSGRRSGARGA